MYDMSVCAFFTFISFRSACCWINKVQNLTVITYNAVGQLWCTVCNVPVKTNLLWNSHVQGRTHREVLYLQLSVVTQYNTNSFIMR